MASTDFFTSQQQQTKGNDHLYKELWKLCAGPLVYIPRNDERVYYFPQGHMEQLEASTDQGLNQRLSMFPLPPKILCRVFNSQLLVEQDTDEIYAQITLIPEEDQTERTSQDPCSPRPSRPKVHSFCKVLTASDTSTHGGFSVLRKHATECLPPLDMNQQTPAQELIAKDLHGTNWHLKHVFRGQLRRHLITTGWSTFVSSKRLAAGDSFVFLRGENDELRVGVKHLTCQQSSMPSSVISSQTMHLGALAMASHAVTTHSLFVVYYKPRYIGTIVGVEDISTQWKSSDWRSLKVKWDAPAPFGRPERVSPWEIEPFVPSAPLPLSQQLAVKNKRPQLHIEGTVLEPTPLIASVWKPSLDTLKLNANLQEQTDHQFFLPSAQSDIGATLINGSPNCLLTRHSDCSQPSYVKTTLNMFADEIEGIKSASNWSACCSNVPPRTGDQSSNIIPYLNDRIKCNAVVTCRVFGVDLKSTSMSSVFEKPTLKAIQNSNVSAEECFPNTTSIVESEQKSDLSIATNDHKQEELHVAPNEGQSKQSSFIRSRIKVQMQGVAVGRAVDLTTKKGYDELITELEQMFMIQGELHQRNRWEIVFTDDEGDMMLIGDRPWSEFCNVVRRISICSVDVNK